MAFENLNYSTEDMDNESIQDKIDAATITIQKLTKGNLENLRVDIKDSASSLTMRGKNGDYIGKVQDNENLTFLGETKTIDHNGVKKLFLKVETNGKIGFVSADYVKGDVSCKPSAISTTPVAASTTPVVASTTPVEEIKLYGITPSVLTSYQDRVINTGAFDGFGSGFESESDLVAFNDKMDEYKNSFELLEKMEHPKVKLLLTFINLWIDKANNVKNNQLLDSWFEDEKTIDDGIQKVTNKIQELLSSTNVNNPAELNNIILEIFNIINKVESEESVIDNVSQIQDLIINGSISTGSGRNKTNTPYNDFNSSLPKLLELSSGGMITDGNTKKTTEIARDYIMHTELKVNFEQLQELRNVGDITEDQLVELGFDRSITKELQKDLKEKWTTAQEESNKHRDKYAEQLELKLNRVPTQKEISDHIGIATDEYIKSGFLTTQLIEHKIEFGGVTGDLADFYSEYTGAWQTFEEWIGDNGPELALMLVPMAGGMILVGALAKAGSFAMKSAHAAKILGTINKGGFVGGGVNGAGFYTGMTVTNNVMYNRAMFDQWNTVDAMKFAVGFNLFNALKLIPKFKNLEYGTMTTPQQAGALLYETIGFTAADYGLETTLGTKKVTWEQILSQLPQDMLFNALFLGAGKFATKGKQKQENNPYSEKEVVNERQALADQIRRDEGNGVFDEVGKTETKAKEKSQNKSDIEIQKTKTEFDNKISQQEVEIKIIDTDLEIVNSKISAKEKQIAEAKTRVDEYIPNSQAVKNAKNKLEQEKKRLGNNEDVSVNLKDKEKYGLSAKAKNGDIIVKLENNLEKIIKEEKLKHEKKVLGPLNKELGTLQSEQAALSGKKTLAETNLSSTKKEYESKVEEHNNTIKEIEQKKKEIEEKAKKDGEKESNVDISEILEKDLNTLKEGGDSIKHLNFETKLKDGEYIISGPDGYKMTFIKKEGAIDALNTQLGNNISKIDLLVKSGEKEALAKLNSLSKNTEGFNIDGKNIRFKKEGDSYKLQEVTPEGIKDLDINTLSTKQNELLLDKMISADGVSKIKDFIDKITPENIFTKTEKDGIIKKYGVIKGKEFLNKTVGNIKKDILDGGKWTVNSTRWLLTGGKGNTFGKGKILGGLAMNEGWELRTDTDHYMNNFFSLEHLGTTAGNILLFRQVGIIRGLAYNALLEEGLEKLTGKEHL
ncbi:MAG: hypothetical protein GY828_01880 [Candidatus Gracilibacteria bacterium]|nr:hypothetical protein [Candidatus Gracilibacteria bacterium]